MNKPDGGPAFPRPFSEPVGDSMAWDQAGMSLRDWFAGQIASGYFVTGQDCGINPSKAASFIYECADAMIAERERQS